MNNFVVPEILLWISFNFKMRSIKVGTLWELLDNLHKRGERNDFVIKIKDVFFAGLTTNKLIEVGGTTILRPQEG
jgi:hypothetical protein